VPDVTARVCVCVCVCVYVCVWKLRVCEKPHTVHSSKLVESGHHVVCSGTRGYNFFVVILPTVG